MNFTWSKFFVLVVVALKNMLSIACDSSILYFLGVHVGLSHDKESMCNGATRYIHIKLSLMTKGAFYRSYTGSYIDVTELNPQIRSSTEPNAFAGVPFPNIS